MPVEFLGIAATDDGSETTPRSGAAFDKEYALRLARAIDDLVQPDAGDGFILVPHLTPGGLDEFADKVVPLLQERGVFRTEYEGTTLRDHLGLAHPDGVRGERAAS